MNKEEIELLLENFTNIIYVNDNPATIESIEISKYDNNIFKKVKSETFILKKLDNLNSQILDEIDEISNSIDVDFYPKNFFAKILSKKKYYNLSKQINTLSNDNWVITNTEIYNNFLRETNINVYINDLMTDMILVGSRLDNIILRIENSELEFFLNKENLLLINLK